MDQFLAWIATSLPENAIIPPWAADDRIDPKRSLHAQAIHQCHKADLYIHRHFSEVGLFF